MDGLRAVALILATMTTGMLAGVYAIYANAFMPGLARTDDRTFVAAFQAVDRAIVNPLFLGLGFLGSLLLTLLAGLLSLGEDMLVWTGIAFVLNLITVITTVAINVPLNDALKAAGDPGTVDATTVRAAFNEARWRTFNLLRTLLLTVALALLCVALHQQ